MSELSVRYADLKEAAKSMEITANKVHLAVYNTFTPTKGFDIAAAAKLVVLTKELEAKAKALLLTVEL